jgi:sugar phosphate isomerase/epimerase
MKVGLSSVTYLGLWYDGPGLAPLELLRRARQLGYDGVELDGRRPHGNPMDLDASRRRAIRDMCAELELDLVAVAAHTDFSSPVIEHRESQLLMLREQIRLARDLGAPVVRVFLASPGVTLRDGIGSHELAERRHEQLWQESTWLEAWNRCKECLREAVRHAEEHEVVLALQNRPPVVRDLSDVLDMIAEVDSPWLRACVDLGWLRRRDLGAVSQTLQAMGHYQVHARFNGRFAAREDGSVAHVGIGERNTAEVLDYAALIGALNEAGYGGYLCYELNEPALDAHHQIQGVEYVDEQAQLALAYVRDVLAGLNGHRHASPNGMPDGLAVSSTSN